MTKDEAALMRPMDTVINPYTSPPWRPLRVTEVFTSPHSGLTRLRFSSYKPTEWFPPDAFVLAPADAHYDKRTGRWMRAGQDVTPTIEYVVGPASEEVLDA